MDYMFGSSGSSGQPRDGAKRRRWPILVAMLGLTLTVGMAACSRGRSEIPYSELKQHVSSGEVAKVSISARSIEAEPTAAAREAGAPKAWVAIPVADDGLAALLEQHHVTYTGVSEEGVRPYVAIPVVLLAVGTGLFVLQRQRRAVRDLSGVADMRVRDAARAPSEIDFAQVAGADEAKEELEEVVGFLKDPDRYARLGARIPKGVLLVGPPGTGKTLLARAVAGEAGVPFFSLSGSEFVELYVGVGASRVRKLFEKAKAKAPCIIFIDELDAVGRSRSGPRVATNDERENTLNQLLVEMDGFEGKSGIVVMAATNRPEVLDSALLRPGRFDRQVLVDRPDRVGREAILRVHARKIKLNADVDLEQVAQRTPGFVGADLANLLNEAALLAARRELTVVGNEEIDDALDRITTGLEKKTKVLHEKERRIVAYHEAGHALVAEGTPNSEPVKKISIVPRGAGALGYMQQIPDERFLYQHDELLDRLAVLLGGRAAEQVTFGQVSTGASNDLERATSIARRMVCEFGMSEALGPVALATRDGGYLASAAQDGARTFSETTAREIDREVQTLVSEAADRARTILEQDGELLETLAQRLLEDEVIEREDFLALLAEYRGA
jgi:cell division protease FtsH